MKPAAVLGLLALTTSLAAADPVDGMRHRRSRRTAFALSAGGAAASLAGVGAGILLVRDHASGGGAIAGVSAVSLLLTPSLGEAYANDPFSTGMKLRLAGTAVALTAGLLEAANDVGCGIAVASADGEGSCKHGALDGVLYAGGALFVAGIAYDVAFAGRAADRYNDEHGLAVVPAVIRTPSTTVAGLGLAARF